jgi:hypothetical protein
MAWLKLEASGDSVVSEVAVWPFKSSKPNETDAAITNKNDVKYLRPPDLNAN